MAKHWIIALCMTLLYTETSATTTPYYVRTTTRSILVTLSYSSTIRPGTTRYSTTRYTPSTPTPRIPSTLSTPSTPSTLSTSATTSATTTLTPTQVTTPAPSDMCSNGQTRIWYWISEYQPASTTVAMAVINNVDTVKQCQDSCTVGAHVNKCKSFKYSPGDRQCSLYDFRYDDTGVTFMTKTDTSYYFQWQCRNYDIPGCASTQHLPMFRYRKAIPTSGIGRQKTEVVSSLANCEDSCIKSTMVVGGVSTECRSIIYREASATVSKSCTLNYWTLQSDSQLSTSNENGFYEKMCFNDPGICSAKLMANRVWFVFTHNTFTAQPIVVISDVSTSQGCKNLCLFRLDKTCKSVQYKALTKQCYLYTGNTDNYMLSDQPDHHIYEFRCPERKVTQCSSNMQLIWAHYRGRVIQTHRDVTIENVQSELQCKLACLGFNEWVCKAVEYDTITKKCVLSGMNRARSELGQGVKGKEEQILYYEWLCKTDSCGENQLKVHFERRNRELMYRDDKVFTEVTTLRQCVKKCSELTEFRCRSLEYSDKTLRCRLSEVTTDEADAGEFVPSTKDEYKYVEWRCRAYVINRCQTSKDELPYWSEYPSSRLNSGYFRIFSQTYSQSRCEEQCMNVATCESLEYRDIANTCELNNADLINDKLLPSPPGNTFLEWNCLKPQLNPCAAGEQSYWKAYIARRYENPSILTITHYDVSTLMACEHLCLKAKQANLINCESIQLHRLNQTCHLFSGTAKWDQLAQDSNEYGYFQRHCRPAVFNRCQAGTEFLPNSTQSGYALRSDVHGIAYASTSKEQCITLCRGYTYFECVSIDYSAIYQKCVLHAVGMIDGFNLQVVPKYSHYEMECIVPPQPSTSIGGSESVVPRLSLIVFALLLCWLQTKYV